MSYFKGICFLPRSNVIIRVLTHRAEYEPVLITLPLSRNFVKYSNLNNEHVWPKNLSR